MCTENYRAYRAHFCPPEYVLSNTHIQKSFLSDTSIESNCTKVEFRHWLNYEELWLGFERLLDEQLCDDDYRCDESVAVVEHDAVVTKWRWPFENS